MVEATSESRGPKGVIQFKDLKRRDIKPITWPGTEKQLGLMLLTVGELQQSHFDARAWFAKQGQDVDLYSKTQLDLEEQYQMIFRMLIEADAKIANARVFHSVKEVRETLSPDERDWFIAQYHSVLVERAQLWDWPKDQDGF
jgi:hypothetical protein